MKAKSKQQIADSAGISINTLNRWLAPYQQELKALGMQRNARLLPPKVVLYIAEKFCIDVE